MRAHYDIPRYSAFVPQATSAATAHHPIIVVGAGLAGLTLTADLALRGIPVVLLDDDDTVGVRGMASRGICYGKRTLEIFDRLGVYDRIRGKGVTWRIGRVYDFDRELYTFDLGEDREKHPPFVNIQQFYVEQYLVERIQQLPHAQIRWRNRVVGLKQDNDKATVDVEAPSAGYQLTCDYLVGCDGAHSTVRKLLGIEAPIEGGDDTWLIIDFWLKAKLPDERRVWIRNGENEGRAVWFHQAADQVWRLDCQIGERALATSAATEDIAAEKVRRLLGSIVGGEVPGFELVDVGPWTYRTYVLDSFRRGRVLLAGDSAHLKSPFGARGGNSAIQDVDNLGWKLALLVRGQGSERLLDSYSQERREAALENVRVTKGSARFLRPRSDMERMLRDTTMRLSSSQAFARALINGGRMSVANEYNLSGSIIADREAEAGLPKKVMPGRIALNGALTRQGCAAYLLDFAGDAFLAVIFADSAASLAPMAARMAELDTGAAPVKFVIVAADDGACGGIPVLKDENDQVRAQYAASNGTMYLLRPDMHVGWRSRTFDLAALEAAKDCILQGLGEPIRPEEEAVAGLSLTKPNFENADRFYQEIEAAIASLSSDEALSFLSALAFVLGNRVGRAAELAESVTAALAAVESKGGGCRAHGYPR